jgi:hypothetical protein
MAGISRYLFRFPINTYNNEKPSYEVIPLRNSDVQKIVIFAGKKELTSTLIDREIFLYLETNVPLSDSNRYKNLRILCYLLELATGLPYEPIEINVAELTSFEKIFDKFKAELFSKPEFRYGGLVSDKNPVMRIPIYSKYLSLLSDLDLIKFENALQTYIWAREIQGLPNPQLHYTLYMTLFLSSIEQLIDSPSACGYKPVPVCGGCGKQFINHHPKDKGNKQAIESFIREMLTGNGVDDAVKRVNRLYGKLRSSFLHSGTLSGAERVGGFMSESGSDMNLILEDMMNTLVLNRQLLEQFLQRGQNKHENR